MGPPFTVTYAGWADGLGDTSVGPGVGELPGSPTAVAFGLGGPQDGAALGPLEASPSAVAFGLGGPHDGAVVGGPAGVGVGVGDPVGVGDGVGDGPAGVADAWFSMAFKVTGAANVDGGDGVALGAAIVAYAGGEASTPRVPANAIARPPSTNAWRAKRILSRSFECIPFIVDFDAPERLLNQGSAPFPQRFSADRPIPRLGMFQGGN
jgi:hypothetical protein